jgi:hypothetical protein
MTLFSKPSQIKPNQTNNHHHHQTPQANQQNASVISILTEVPTKASFWNKGPGILILIAESSWLQSVLIVTDLPECPLLRTEANEC